MTASSDMSDGLVHERVRIVASSFGPIPNQEQRASLVMGHAGVRQFKPCEMPITQLLAEAEEARVFVLSQVMCRGTCVE